MKTNSKDFLKEVAENPELAQELKSVNTTQKMLEIAQQAGYELTNHDLTAAMRSLSAKLLDDHGLPHWAIDSMFLGESVCW